MYLHVDGSLVGLAVPRVSIAVSENVGMPLFDFQAGNCHDARTTGKLVTRSLSDK